MYIGIDARAVSHPQAGGFKTFTAGLLWGLARVARPIQHRFLLFFDRPYRLPDGQHEWFECQVAPATAPLLGAFFREQLRLPKMLAHAGVQLAHFPCNVAPATCRVPFLVTIHDLAPLRSVPLHPLTRRTLHDLLLWSYWRVLIPVAARQALAVLTDSRASQEEIVHRLRIPSERVFVIPGAASLTIRPVNRATAQDTVRKLFGAEPPYVLAIASKEPRKNTSRLLQAYSQLPSSVRQRYPLVIVVSHPSLGRSLAQAGLALGIAENLRLVPSPSDPQLSALYSAAHLFAFPSLYEGFGLPVLEAMQCGTPVVTSRRSSLPEVVGDAAVLVDPTVAEDIRAGIENVLTSDALWQELATRGTAQAQRFSWESTARKLLEIYDWAEEAVRSEGR